MWITKKKSPAHPRYLKIFIWSLSSFWKCLEKSLEGGAAVSGHWRRSGSLLLENPGTVCFFAARSPTWPCRQHSSSQADPTPLPDSNLETQREWMAMEESSWMWEVWASRHSRGRNSQKSVYWWEGHRGVTVCRALVREGLFCPGGKTPKEMLWVKINHRSCSTRKKQGTPVKEHLIKNINGSHSHLQF